ncbi:hypothetical protein G7Y79_00008g025140 [Physcia stellaris]|nr:hypothetical protein G7Y79_00008g025140 [Physcia stellaris]
MDPSKAGPTPRGQTAEFWSDLGLKYQAPFENDPQRIAAVQKWLSFLQPSSTVLECGCGTGIPIARTVVNSGHHYHGIDLAEGMVEICRRQIPEGILEVADMTQYKPSREYEGVVASLSFFELSRDEQIAMGRRWYEWLKPGGYFMLSTISIEGYDVEAGSFDSATECTSGVEAMFMGSRLLVNIFTQKGWRMLLEKAGFKIVHTETDLFEPAAEDTPPEPRYYVIARKNLESE